MALLPSAILSYPPVQFLPTIITTPVALPVYPSFPVCALFYALDTIHVYDIHADTVLDTLFGSHPLAEISTQDAYPLHFFDKFYILYDQEVSFLTP